MELTCRVRERDTEVWMSGPNRDGVRWILYIEDAGGGEWRWYLGTLSVDTGIEGVAEGVSGGAREGFDDAASYL